MYDFHFHSNFSFDSKSKPESIVKLAIDRGFKVICFTDHIDYDADLKHHDYSIDYDEYFKQLNELKDKYKDEIEVLAGAEFGIQKHLIEKYHDVASKYPFDFIISSIHTVEGYDLAIDGFIEKHGSKEAIKRYYDTMEQCLDLYKDFDILGHLDYFDRYFTHEHELPGFEFYRDTVKEIYKKVIEMDKGIELNAGGLRKTIGYYHPKEEALKMYFDMGGTIVTFGSDAHLVSQIGMNYNDVIDHAKKLGLKELSVYRNRQRSTYQV